MWKNYFFQLLNVHSVNNVRQTEIHTSELSALGPSPFEVVIATAKMKKYKSPHSDQIPTYMIQAGGEILWPKINK
jgi:hypothetical protein